MPNVEVLGVDVSKQSKIRDYFMLICHINPVNPSGFFMGKVVVLENQKVLIKNLYVAFFDRNDNLFEGIEDHAWSFESLKFKSTGIITGDNVSFYADVVPYKRKDGTADYSVKNIRELKLIETYKLPSDQELIEQNKIIDELLFS